MSSVTRATFDTLKADLDATMLGAVSQFATTRGLSYDSEAMRAQCGWTGDATTDMLMFGCGVFPSDIDDDGGEPMIPTPIPANDTFSRSRLALAAGLLLALTAGMWTSTAVDGADAGSAAFRNRVHDATLPVTGTSVLLTDGIG